MNDDLRLMLRARRAGGVVTRDDVAAVGLSANRWRRRIDSGEWVRVVPGYWRHAATPLTWEVEVRTVAAWLGAAAALYGATAAAWWGLDGFEPIGRAQFVVPRGRRWLAGPLDVHTTTRWTSADLTLHRGVRCTSVTRTIIDVAAGSCAAHRLAAAIDSGIRTHRTSQPMLWRRLAEVGGPGRVGAPRLRELLSDGGSESWLPHALESITSRRPQPPTARRVAPATVAQPAIATTATAISATLRTT